MRFFGTAKLLFADGIEAQPGDQFEISLDAFGEFLRTEFPSNSPASSVAVLFVRGPSAISASCGAP